MRWTNSDSLNGREALVVGGTHDGLRIVVREKDGEYRYADVFELTGYEFDPQRWEFRVPAHV